MGEEAEGMAKKKRGLARRLLTKAMAWLGAALMFCVFYVAVVLGQPQESQQESVLADQPVLGAAAAQSIAGDDQLQSLLQTFPVAVLCAPGSPTLTLESGHSYDLTFENGYGRITRLIYRSQEGVQVQVDSIYPARALALMDGAGYRLSGVAGQSLAGMRSVRMENGSAIRLHAQSAEGLYAVTLPRSAEGSIAALIRPLQLLQNGANP